MTEQSPDAIAKFVFYAVMACWMLFAATFLLRKRSSAGHVTRRDWSSMLGLLIQSGGFFVIWARPWKRPEFSPLVAMPRAAEIAVAALTIAIALFSVWLVNSAVRELGEQWALPAQLVEGHNLVTGGPYRLVRNPIYTGMLGMLVATGMAVTQWPALLAAIAVFVAGTYLRVRVEERLLRGQFGAEFDEYVRRVSAVIPGIW